jgi:hypothetical protein
VIVSTWLLAHLILVTRQHVWLSDWWCHLATVAEMARHPWHPIEPLTGTDTPWAYFSPYTLLLGLFSRTSGMAPESVLEAAGILDVFVWLLAMRAFTRLFSPRPAVATLSVVATLFLWGVRPWWWSGVLSLGSLSMGPGWPSVPATAATLFTWTAAWRAVAHGPWALPDGLPGWTRPRFLAVAFLPGVIFLTHPFTGLLCGMGLAAIVAGRGSLRRDALPLLATTAITLLVVLAWPYYPALGLLGHPHGYDDIHDDFYQHIVLRFGLVAVGLPALILRARKNLFDPLVLMAAMASVVVLAGGALETASLGRAWPLLALPCHVSLALAVGDPDRAPRPRLAVLFAPAMLLGVVLGLHGTGYGFLRILPRDMLSKGIIHESGLPAAYDDVTWATSRMKAGAVVAADDRNARRQIPAYGVYTLIPAWPDLFLYDADERELAMMAILGEDVAARRTALAGYHVSWVLLKQGYTWAGAPQDGTMVAVGPEGEALYEVELAGTGTDEDSVVPGSHPPTEKADAESGVSR